MHNSPNSRSFYLRFIALSLLVSLFLGACQPFANTSPDPQRAMLPPTATATTAPTQTPAPIPSILWLDPVLPADFLKKVKVPEGVSTTKKQDEANIFLTAGNPPKGSALLGETWLTYALAAPFFTVQDDISLADLRTIARGAQPKGMPTTLNAILVRNQDSAVLARVLSLSSSLSARNGFSQIADEFFRPGVKPQAGTWAVLPFELLTPQWKVISIGEKSPLDDDFEPESTPLTQRITLSTTIADASLTEEELSALLPAPNRDHSQLTSLIMSGVTAMARDTAFVMSTEGVLFPGTEIRDFMRAADLTHISNEVSFYEGCPFPDPDYTGYIFCSDPEYIDLLDDLGADIIELTGNHNNDVRALYKVDSVPFTLDLYREYGMQWYAGGVNITDAKAPLLIEHNGNKLAFIGCNSYGPDMAWATEESSGAAPCENFGWITEEVTRLRGQGYLPIVTFQYQEDYLVAAQSSAIRDFRPLADAGAVIVNGSQSHVAKAMEFWNNGFIHYGLGNLFFDQPEFYITYDGIIQKHFFYQGRHISTQLLTITLQETAKPRPMTPEERQKFLNGLFETSSLLKE
ncbi:MAG TPA: CapA family protein [Anaerolineaceae bacterium]|nr:CapA family protein [Anaerolineaceae bacterium]